MRAELIMLRRLAEVARFPLEQNFTTNG